MIKFTMTVAEWQEFLKAYPNETPITRLLMQAAQQEAERLAKQRERVARHRKKKV